MIRLTPRFTLFPYTTLFGSSVVVVEEPVAVVVGEGVDSVAVLVSVVTGVDPVPVEVEDCVLGWVGIVVVGTGVHSLGVVGSRVIVEDPVAVVVGEGVDSVAV